jgi:RHS repeat-associated protein
VGNRLTEISTLLPDTVTSSKTFTYDGRNRLSSVTDDRNGAANTTYEYDANGNQTRRLQGGTPTEFHYDVRDKLIEVDRGTLLESYVYDYQGFRIRKTGPDGTVRYVYDDDSVLVQTDDAGTTLAKYDYGPDRLLAMTHATEGRQFYLFDGLGSITNLVKPDGGLAARYQYDAWGNYRATAGSSFSIFGFTGHQRDAATGLYYFKARYYDPELGVFLTEDPAAGDANTPPSLHRYLYAYANPTIYIDPDGRITFIKDAKKKLETLAEEGLSSIDETSSTAEVVKTGLTSGLLKAGADFLGLYNIAANVAAQALPGTKAEKESNAEIKQTVDKIKHAVKAGVKRLEEDYDGTVKKVLELPDRLIEAAVKKGLQATAGDKKAQSDVLSESTRGVVEIAAGEEVVRGAGLAEEGLAASEVASVRADAGVAEAGAGATKVLGAAVRGGEPAAEMVGGKVATGPWANGVTNVVEDGVFTQCADGSCVAATGQVLTGGAVSEQQLLGRIGEWSNPQVLAKELNRLNPSAGWKGGYFADEADALAVANSGRSGIVLQAPGAPAHMVTVEPLAGSSDRFLVHDTGAGVTFHVDSAWIKKYAAGGVWK